MVVAGVCRAPDNADRFYCPPPLRRQRLLLQQQQQQQQQQEQMMQAQRHSPGKQDPHPPPQPATETETPTASDVSSLKPSVSSTSSSPSSSSPSSSSPRSSLPAGNLERFLKFTTPIVPARYLPTVGNGWSGDDESSPVSPPYFELGDLWDSFGEWSAYGAGVPLVLNGSDSVVQYYVPSLSAIQLYVDSQRLALKSRTNNEARAENNQESLRNNVQECLCRNHGVAHQQPHIPVFQYLEHDPPYGRLPLADKISTLARNFPGLKTYRSCDLLPSSWISVSWYPIYRIPTGSTLQDLDACFLTFHSLTVCSKEKNSRFSGVGEIFNIQNNNGLGRISLPTFGLASYKFKGSVWSSNGVCEQQLLRSLMQAADNWLQLGRVDHPDYLFFRSRYSSSYK